MNNREDTEIHIKNTAKKIFFSMGRLHAKTQEIADEAKVNRALLHYYFRNRDNLFEIVLKEALDESHKAFFKIIASTDDFELKISEIVSHMLERTLKYPFMETFFVSEMMQSPEKLLMMPSVSGSELDTRKKFKEDINDYILKYDLPHKNSQHFIANLFAMCVYPSVAKPLLMNLFQFDEKDFKNFIEERKLVITKLLLGKK